jgi:hypothetical protein
MQGTLQWKRETRLRVTGGAERLAALGVDDPGWATAWGRRIDRESREATNA